MNTLAKVINFKGIGLHTGKYVHGRIYPDEQNPIHFIRTDKNDMPIVAETVRVWQSHLCTQIGTSKDNSISTIEHLMAALHLYEIDHARIEIDNSELPFLDGSAIIWARKIVSKPSAHTVARKQSRYMKLVQKKDSFVMLWGHPEIHIHSSIQFEEWYECYHYDGEMNQILGARSFVLEKSIRALKQRNLIQGGSLTNALVKTVGGWKNGPLRWENEAARHKVLDLIGDLSLAKVSNQHMIISYKSGHMLNIQMGQMI
nr:UDP-3-O-[3-hydroxymyristoyl] GlcNAc deacetylase [Cyanidioschyzonaceae sp. 1]